MQHLSVTMNSPRRAFACAGLVFLLAGPAAAQQLSVGLRPAVAYFDAKPGQVAQHEFGFENKGTAELVLEVSVADAWYSDDDGRTYPTPGTSPQGAGAWVAAPPSELVIQPGKRSSFTGRIQIPDGAKPGTYYAAYLGKVKPASDNPVATLKKKETRAGGKMVARVAVIVVVEVLQRDGTKVGRDLRITARQIKATEGEPVEFAFELENRSRGGLQGAGQILVLDATQNVVGRVDVSQYSLWPGQKLWVRERFNVPMNRGTYNAVAAFEAPDVPVASLTVPFDVKPQAPVAPVRERAVPEPKKPPKGNRAKKGTG